ncbi:MAG: nucleotidyl transferase AbiEii/AbiGii toxin family protein [Candidatus Rokubacteria bacterium]|nr:nucleotidyl transferase AbiEii/AbiGii toxin family protein [Candidatus Rokubacteria bacterium]MBI3105804.1 nucleotidyl transferase AbiEii/AbiGii toxin family protein [Candidatus Rokubacteria bacterium]
MIATLTPRFTKLPPAQRRLWPRLRPSVPLEFVLYGGTALSLHLGHRRSVDFDFFHDRPLDLPALRSAFGFLATAPTLQETKDTLVVLAAGVKVSFFGGLRFGRVGDPLLTRDGVAEVASLDDLMAHKLKVVLQRAEKKDYQDIAAMLRAGLPLAKGLAAARLLFGASFQPAESLKALTYFGDGDLPGLAKADRSALITAAAAVGDLPRAALRSRALAIPVA